MLLVTETSVDVSIADEWANWIICGGRELLHQVTFFANPQNNRQINLDLANARIGQSSASQSPVLRGESGW